MQFDTKHNAKVREKFEKETHTPHNRIQALHAKNEQLSHKLMSQLEKRMAIQNLYKKYFGNP